MLVETPNPRFAIDGRMLDRDGTGVSTYARALRDALLLLGHAPLTVRDAHCTPDPAPPTRFERWWRWSETRLDCPRWLWRRNMYARDIFRLAQVHFNRHGTLLRFHPGGTGVVHWTYPVPLAFVGWTNIYTVHDAIPLTRPELSQIDALRHRRLLTRIVARADCLMTVTEAARADIVRELRCDPSLVIACPTGLDVAQTDAALPVGLRPGEYLLAVGNVEPRKNLKRLAEAHRLSGTSLPLVIAGPTGWHSERIETSLARYPGVIRLTRLPRPVLLSLIARARALLFPTLAEGFGLPIVEAMSLGTAVMTSRTGATAEITGGAALLIDPENPDEIAAAIGALAADDALVGRLVAAGLQQSRHFTANAFAERIARVHAMLGVAKVAPDR